MNCRSSAEHLQLPVPSSKNSFDGEKDGGRARRVATLAQWANPLCHDVSATWRGWWSRDGLKLSPLASSATVDCGVAAADWRKSVRQVAQSLGYDSTAFITMFKGLGQTPRAILPA